MRCLTGEGGAEVVVEAEALLSAGEAEVGVESRGLEREDVLERRVEGERRWSEMKRDHAVRRTTEVSEISCKRR